MRFEFIASVLPIDDLRAGECAVYDGPRGPVVMGYAPTERDRLRFMRRRWRRRVKARVRKMLASARG